MNLSSIRNKTSKALWLGQKFLLQHLKCRANLEPLPLFIVGCQRSGTNMLLEVLGKSLDTWIYSANNARAFSNRRIRPVTDRRRLLERARCQWVVFKPLSDSQNIDRLLADHPEAKAIWIFRQYQDVANSAVRSWGPWQLAHIRRIAQNPEWRHWMVERMSDSRRQLVKRLYHPEMSLHTAAALKWYLRNEIYFDCALEQQPGRVKLVKYEDLVCEPAKHFRLLFDFLDLQFRQSFVSTVRGTSVAKEERRQVDEGVEKLCEKLTNRFNEALIAKAQQEYDLRSTARAALDRMGQCGEPAGI